MHVICVLYKRYVGIIRRVIQYNILNYVVTDYCLHNKERPTLFLCINKHSFIHYK